MLMLWLLSVMFLSNCIVTAYQEDRTVLDSFLPIFRVFKSLSFDTQEKHLENPRYLNHFNEIGKLQKVPKNIAFPCDSRRVKFRSDKVPESVHQVRPGDIKVVGAMGDSLTAGFGATATDFLQVFYESRGRSFSGGGQEDWKTYLTLPNILKTFNPNIIGYSLNSISTNRKSRFNVAEGGAYARDIPYMAKVLIKRIKSDKQVNFKKDWKMITIMIGDNDFCSEMCYQKDLNVVLKRHRQDIVQVLRILRDNLPRTIINLLPPPHLQILVETTGKPSQCFAGHLFLCPCLFGTIRQAKLPIYYDFMRRWQLTQLEVANMDEFDRDNFTIIPHTFTLNYTFPTTPDGRSDFTYLSHDCFHFSQKGHARFANHLWNSIMTPWGKKAIDGAPEFKEIICPSEKYPYIFTRKNSR